MKKDYADYLLKYSVRVYDKIASEFSKTRQGFWNDLNFLFDYIKDGQKILDLGCGNGRLWNILKEKNIEYIGVDNSEQLLLEAHHAFPDFKERFVKADALNLPFKENEFDVIMSIAVLQHIPSFEYRLKFLEECKRVLKNNGKILLTVWSVKNGSKHYKVLNNFWNNFKAFLKISKMDANDLLVPFKTGDQQNIGNRYIHAFSLKELQGLFKKAGFLIESSGYTFDKSNKKRNLYIIAFLKD